MGPGGETGLRLLLPSLLGVGRATSPSPRSWAMRWPCCHARCRAGVGVSQAPSALAWGRPGVSAVRGGKDGAAKAA